MSVLECSPLFIFCHLKSQEDSDQVINFLLNQGETKKAHRLSVITMSWFRCPQRLLLGCQCKGGFCYFSKCVCKWNFKKQNSSLLASKRWWASHKPVSSISLKSTKPDCHTLDNPTVYNYHSSFWNLNREKFRCILLVAEQCAETTASCLFWCWSLKDAKTHHRPDNNPSPNEM